MRLMTRLMKSSLLMLWICCSLSADEIRILPGDFTLHGAEGRQQLSVVSIRDQRVSAVIPESELRLETSDPEVLEIRGGVAFAKGDGTAKVIARSRDGDQATATVKVVATGRPHRWSFRNDVQSVFAKVGCNMGACHGALAGKGGFKLSLRGYDPDADFHTITREARGRRVELSDPGRSLILAKPTGALPHKGGLKLKTTSRDYRVISQWIADGAEGPNAN